MPGRTNVITFLKGDLFASKAQTLVNTVNCRGVMGKGIALEFKKRFPGLFQFYVNAYLSGEVKIGSVTIWKGPERWVLNFPTKDDWRKPSNYEFIEKGLVDLRGKMVGWEITSLAIPALGCGLGSLDWNKVKPMIEIYLGDLEINVEVYEPA